MEIFNMKNPQEEPKQTKCYCGHTTTCDCGPLEISNEAKQRAKNYMSLKGALEPKNFQYVDFSNPNADKITSTSTISNKQETLEEAGVAYSKTVNENHTSHMLGFYNGAKWQAERMYSEEEVYELLLKHQSAYRSAVRNTYPLDWSFDIKQWFDQFKKK